MLNLGGRRPDDLDHPEQQIGIASAVAAASLIKISACLGVSLIVAKIIMNLGGWLGPGQDQISKTLSRTT